MTSPNPTSATAAGRHLGAVADVFLPLERSPARSAPQVAPDLCAAAPGDGDTSRVLAVYASFGACGRFRDLGGGIGDRIARWEGADRSAPPLPARSTLLWCPRGAEAMTVRGAVLLGRLGALLRPEAVHVLWLAAGSRPPGRRPTGRQVRHAARLASAAIPGIAVDVHCLGWLESIEQDARRLLIGQPVTHDVPWPRRR